LIYSGERLQGKFNERANEENKVDYDSSTIKEYLDKFYSDNLSEYDELIVNHKYCIDTSFEGNYRKLYGSYLRNINGSNPSLNCNETTLEYGGLKEYKIGLLTMDELGFAGLNSIDYNDSNYLFDGSDFYTMSAGAFNYKAYVGVLDRNGKIDTRAVNEVLEIRPVIVLDKQLEVEGKGTIDNPYLIIR
jgi:hypothetical protein